MFLDPRIRLGVSSLLWQSVKVTWHKCWGKPSIRVTWLRPALLESQGPFIPGSKPLWMSYDFREMGPEAFLGMSGMSGQLPCERTHLKKALCQTCVLSGALDKYQCLYWATTCFIFVYSLSASWDPSADMCYFDSTIYNVRIAMSKFCCILYLNVVHTCRIKRRGEYSLEHGEGKIICTSGHSMMCSPSPGQWLATSPGVAMLACIYTDLLIDIFLSAIWMLAWLLSL